MGVPKADREGELAGPLAIPGIRSGGQSPVLLQANPPRPSIRPLADAIKPYFGMFGHLVFDDSDTSRHYLKPEDLRVLPGRSAGMTACRAILAALATGWR